MVLGGGRSVRWWKCESLTHPLLATSSVVGGIFLSPGVGRLAPTSHRGSYSLGLSPSSEPFSATGDPV